MTATKLTFAIVGAGIGGLTAASTLRRIGIDAQVYEQAARFTRVGAGIQMMPNSMKVLRSKGRIVYRAVFSSVLLDGFDIGRSRTKWWGINRHIVIYYVTAARSELYFVTSVPEPAGWVTRESWSATGDVRELRKAYEGFHPDVTRVLEACPDCHKWAILEREPLPRWSSGRVVLLGDACHPMTPYMAQGGATAIEDAAILARCLEEVEGDDIEGAFRRYEAHRKPRTSRIQAISSANTWMKGGNDDTTWLYGYDAWNVPLTPAEPVTA